VALVAAAVLAVRAANTRDVPAAVAAEPDHAEAEPEPEPVIR
jgi:hypothetical protein